MAKITVERRLELLQLLIGIECEVCGGRKRANESFCSADYKSLPRPMATCLYQPFFAGYELSYETALAWLRDKREGGNL